MHDGSGKLPYETIRDYQVIIIHMTGYNADVIWDWLRIRKDGLKIISSCNILLGIGIPIFQKIDLK